MLKHMRLYRFLLTALLVAGLSFGEDSLKERFSLKVRVIGKILEEKPRLMPPERLSVEGGAEPLDLTSEVLEPPKFVEPANVVPPKAGSGCGEPKDRVKFRAGVRYYLKGDLKRAESRFLDVLSIPKAVYIGPAQYMLGLIYSEKGQRAKALRFFEESCSGPHQYRKAACEAYYALHFSTKGTLPEEIEIDFWRAVDQIKGGKVPPPPPCEGTVFKDYCFYITDFIEGRINDSYPDSTALRRGIILVKEGKLREAKEIFRSFTGSRSKYRDVAFYYLGVIALREGNKREAYKKASFLETLNPEYAENLHYLLSSGDVLFSRIAYRLTGRKEILRFSGIHSYNQGNYELAFRDFLESGDYLRALWSAIRSENYRLARSLIDKFPRKSREDYLWTLEVLYWNEDWDGIERVLGEVKGKFPDLYNEYTGWVYFKREDWQSAYKHFSDPYHRALAMYNAGKYRKVIEILKKREDLKARILKAKAAISMGDGKLARTFIKGNYPTELYLLGMSYFIEGNYSKAIEYFSSIKDDEELGLKALLRIGDSYYNMNRYDRAREIYRKILKDYKDAPEAQDAVLALAQIELQNPSQDLVTLLEEFRRKFPDSPMINDLKYQLAILEIRKGNRSKAKEILYELMELEAYRPRALLKLAEIEEDPLKKETMLRDVIRIGRGEVKERATGMLMGLFVERKEYEKLADFLVKGDYSDKKKALEIYIKENLEKAVKLFDELYKQSPGDEDLALYALKLYHKTKGTKYLKIASRSSDKRVRAQALYLLGRKIKGKDRRKALEYFVEVIMSSEGIQPYYNDSIFEAVDILVKLKARRDASCLLAKLDKRSLTKRDRKKVKILKSKLPACKQ